MLPHALLQPVISQEDRMPHHVKFQRHNVEKSVKGQILHQCNIEDDEDD